VRRDFTINAMYYDPTHQTVHDYHGGIEDIRHKTLRIIGAPEARFREDPVRLLRVVRFAAKLNFTIAPDTRAPMAVMAPLINNVPAARVFDEMLKLLMSGHALACLRQLRKEGLHHGLLPLLDVVLEQPLGEKFVTLALANTDQRITQGKPVSPGFLFASLLWHQVLEKWTAYQAAGEYTIPALHLAADDVLDSQTEKLALQRRIASDMRDIWAMQPRFERRVGKAPYKLLEHPRLRAGYDFMLLRCASGEIDAELGEWWTDFMDADGSAREALLNKKPLAEESGAPKKRRRRGGRGRSQSGGGTEGEQ
jgi:poly(A) polymerase